MEEQRAARCAEWQVARFIKNYEIKLYRALGDLSGLADCFILLKCIDQFNGREEAHSSTIVLDGLDAGGSCGMGFPVRSPAISTMF